MSDGTRIDREKLLSVGFMAGGRTRPKVVEGRDADGYRFKATTDELNNTITERHSDRQDAHIRAPLIQVKADTREVR